MLCNRLMAGLDDAATCKRDGNDDNVTDDQQLQLVDQAAVVVAVGMLLSLWR
jgi:hypothetical protein